MAVGAEKVKDSGYQGLNAFPIPNDGTARTLTAAAMFSMVAPAYGKKYGVGEDELTEVLARISWKNHQNGARNPRAQFRKEVSTETICASPRVAGRLGVFDCAGVADGAAAAIVVRAEDAHRYTDKPLYIKALSFAAGSGSGLIDPEYDYTWFPECATAAQDAYAQAGITDPRHQLAMAEVHDCFTPTELVLMEDLGFAARGTAWKEVLAGTFDRTGQLPVNPDGGLKSFGHPVGASGLRMFFETWLQLRGEATPERQIDTDRTLALTHNLGGYPGEMGRSCRWSAPSRLSRTRFGHPSPGGVTEVVAEDQDHHAGHDDGQADAGHLAPTCRRHGTDEDRQARTEHRHRDRAHHTTTGRSVRRTSGTCTKTLAHGCLPEWPRTRCDQPATPWRAPSAGVRRRPGPRPRARRAAPTRRRRPDGRLSATSSASAPSRASASTAQSPWSASMVACTSQKRVPAASMPYQRRSPSPLVAAIAAAWVS